MRFLVKAVHALRIHLAMRRVSQAEARAERAREHFGRRVQAYLDGLSPEERQDFLRGVREGMRGDAE